MASSTLHWHKNCSAGTTRCKRNRHRDATKDEWGHTLTTGTLPNRDRRTFVFCAQLCVARARGACEYPIFAYPCLGWAKIETIRSGRTNSMITQYLGSPHWTANTFCKEPCIAHQYSMHGARNDLLRIRMHCPHTTYCVGNDHSACHTRNA